MRHTSSLFYPFVNQAEYDNEGYDVGSVFSDYRSDEVFPLYPLLIQAGEVKRMWLGANAHASFRPGTHLTDALRILHATPPAYPIDFQFSSGTTITATVPLFSTTDDFDLIRDEVDFTTDDSVVHSCAIFP